MSEQYICAFPHSLHTHETLEGARALAHQMRKFVPTKIYKLVEVEHWMPQGGPMPDPTPSPSGTPEVEQELEAKAA